MYLYVYFLHTHKQTKRHMRFHPLKMIFVGGVTHHIVTDFPLSVVWFNLISCIIVYIYMYVSCIHIHPFIFPFFPMLFAMDFPTIFLWQYQVAMMIFPHVALRRRSRCPWMLTCIALVAPGGQGRRARPTACCSPRCAVAWYGWFIMSNGNSLVFW